MPSNAKQSTRTGRRETTGGGRAASRGDRARPASVSAPRPARVRFDEIDRAILETLQGDSKITNHALAERVGVSPAATLERVRKLEQAGVITGYHARVDPGSVGKTTSAIIHVTLREHGVEALQRFKAFIEPFEEVQACWHTTGEEDFILKVLVSDMAHYERFVVHSLSAAPQIGRVRTSFCLSAVKDETRVPLDAAGE